VKRRALRKWGCFISLQFLKTFVNDTVDDDFIGYHAYQQHPALVLLYLIMLIQREAGSPFESTLSRILTRKSTTNKKVMPKSAAKKGATSSFNT